MSFLKRLSGLFAPGSMPSAPAERRAPAAKPAAPVDTKALAQARAEQQQVEAALSRAKEELAVAGTQAKELVIAAKEEALQIKQQASDQINRLRQESEQLQKDILYQKAGLEKENAILEEKKRLLDSQMKGVTTKMKSLDESKAQLIAKLEKVAGLSRDEAKKLLLEATEKKLTEEIAQRIKKAEDQIREEADHKAREILTEAMRFGATDYVSEYTVSTVKLADEAMKGRIIGKEGRNIRTFEKATGVDVDLDEEGVIRLSSFDSVRREIARVALEKLMRDGRIQPARIEEIVHKTKIELDRLMQQAGELMCREVNVYNLPRELIQMLGRFKYRFSYGQNMITHTIEETKIGVALSHEVGANVNIVRLGCLLHDIGKVITEEEGSHVQLGVDFLKKFNIPQPVLDCVAQHHEDESFSSVEAVLVYIADAISGARPGARYEDHEEYAKRLKALEDLAKGFKGVSEAYAIQAGREVRVIVKPDELDDKQTIRMAHQLKEKIEKNLTYPGTVKVTAIREFRQSEVAK